MKNLPTLLIALLAVASGVMAFTLDSYSLLVFTLCALATVVGVSLNILIGLSGQISFGHIAFYAIGAYVSALLTLAGWPLWLALPIAGVAAGVIGALLAIPVAGSVQVVLRRVLDVRRQRIAAEAAGNMRLLKQLARVGRKARQHVVAVKRIGQRVDCDYQQAARAQQR